MRVGRRRFLQVGGSLAVAALGTFLMARRKSGSRKDLSSVAWQVGIGEDPGRFIWEIESSPEVAAVAQAWDPHFLSGWLNSFDHKTGDLSFWRDWHRAGWLSEWFEQGYSLHVITWEDDTILPCGEYHLSEQFVEDVRELAGYIAQANPHGIRTDWSLATEFSYWRLPADTYNADTAPYYQALMQNLLRARRAIKDRLPEAQVALCWGGWIATFDEPERGAGRSMVDPFAEMMSQMDGIAFQSMRQRRPGEFNPELNGPDPGNPEQIRLCCQLFSPIHPNLMLAHYEPAIKDKHPSGGRADTVQGDFQLMSQSDWLTEVMRLGLRRMSLMHYGLYKGDPFGALTAARQFRTQIAGD
ncbi:hypothetical protein L1047_02900 [Synechococcus sp. Nb3U1]|uniref:hypothetical protein n=1 Tax=Synechococcus sp. Nb3U1 TaxID=1914529 RepID=UPI001F37C04A|nr:hypothetical protein [Synechococcus sp. Nb3U1]MCF2970145.1 hypothetical protein [Synechococcus sp. Nb3U1]